MIVVSEIGEQWSPYTAPAMQAAMIGVDSSGCELVIASPSGIRIPNVPHDVPDANASTHAIRKSAAGMTPTAAPLIPSTSPLTKSARPRLSVIALSDHASVSTRIGGTMACIPLGMQLMQSPKLMVLLHV